MESDSTSITETPSFVKPENPPKYFGIDIDGTFYTSNEEAWERNIEAFAEVRKKGYTPFFCTGRPIDSALRAMGNGFTERTGYQGYPGIYNDGSIVYDKDGNLIYSKSLPKEFLSTFLKCIEDGALPTICTFHTKDAVYSLIKAEGKWVMYLESQGLTVPEVKTPQEIREFEIVNIYIFCESLKIGDLKEDVDYTAVTSAPGLFNINPVGVTKLSSMKILLSHLNDSLDFCGFIGDGDNDMECLEECNISFAVGNSPDEVKKHAKWVLDKTCDEGAVAEALKLTYDL
ncbi:haloacid dehalogenase-like hydrolase family member protein [Theileria equi strain WA]|uniref:Haloacid dehalogenase-like hydrolase family member protein n=1 Tax=Theileria equi strain WA TaxID=1537102 RepID=L0AZ49_THEEQ|nr:haloacid dehalogenase-like hydrolase family member protein [Theileria equi strain WA]AFZ80835.1 haloacid dehalogenase-like hydrolase family member protein [Theileria equi strain WA]|eukprot:XP_004830501.1 haloacid dehalogenase-like hydrolase family member protein [Theileria equi strain WA]